MVSFARINVSGALKKLENFEQIVQEEAVKMSEEIAEFGADEMRTNILASGTPFSQKARQAGINKGPGRYRTGAMYEAVDSRVESSRSVIRAAFGWIKKFEDYFRYQEEGFKNRFLARYTSSGRLMVDSGRPSVYKNPYGGYKNTKGMFALRDARRTVENELPRFTKKYEGIIARRVRAASR